MILNYYQVNIFLDLDTDRIPILIPRRFPKEAEALSKLNHPNIATVFDLDTLTGTAFLVRELVSGPTLAERLAGVVLGEKEVARLAEERSAGCVDGFLSKGEGPALFLAKIKQLC
jgi:serine/threonine protein kinase